MKKNQEAPSYDAGGLRALLLPAAARRKCRYPLRWSTTAGMTFPPSASPLDQHRMGYGVVDMERLQTARASAPVWAL